jgi:uncharacterized protein YjbI with pentapeptide repeats
MADDDHIAQLRKGPVHWNGWRAENVNVRPELRKADLSGASLIDANLAGADLAEADLTNANLRGAGLRGVDLREARLSGVDLSKGDLCGADLSGVDLRRTGLGGADLRKADLSGADLRGANLVEANLNGGILSGADLSGANLLAANLGVAYLKGANLSEADLTRAILGGADLSGAILSGAKLGDAMLVRANLSEANLSGAKLWGANLNRAILRGANLGGAILEYAQLSDTDLTNANLTDCHVYGLSAWGLKLDRTHQQNLVITREGEPEITVDNIEVAQFVYLLLHNAKIRDAIDTIGKKGVLLLGRFTEGRMAVLERLREELRNRGYLPIVFNFEKSEKTTFTETVRLLAGLSRFVIADVTNPRSAPLELQATVPEIMVPLLPIIEEGQEPFSMLTDLWIKHREWVFEPLHYSSLDALVGALDDEIIGPAEARFDELIVRKAETMKGRHV